MQNETKQSLEQWSLLQCLAVKNHTDAADNSEGPTSRQQCEERGVVQRSVVSLHSILHVAVTEISESLDNTGLVFSRVSIMQAAC